MLYISSTRAQSELILCVEGCEVSYSEAVPVFLKHASY